MLPEDATPYFTCHKTTGCVLPGEDVTRPRKCKHPEMIMS